MQLAKIPLDRAPTATEVGFRIAPRINAAGRMDIASDVVELFLTRDPARAHELADKLDRLNQDRRDSEAQALDAIDQRTRSPCIDADGAYPAECIILDHPDWHRGVLGILASRVVDRTGRPALVLTHADGNAHGSGRSIPGFHLLDAITAADTADPVTPLFNRFGGHAHAVGFSLPSDRLPLLRARMHSYASSRLTTELLIPQLDYDAELTLADINPDLFNWIARCAPFGIGNPRADLPHAATSPSPHPSASSRTARLPSADAIAAATGQDRRRHPRPWLEPRHHRLARHLCRPHSGLRGRYPVPHPPQHRPLRGPALRRPGTGTPCPKPFRRVLNRPRAPAVNRPQTLYCESGSRNFWFLLLAHVSYILTANKWRLPPSQIP